MKLRSVVVVMSASLIGATTPGFAQAAHGDEHYRGDRHYGGGHGGYSGHGGYGSQHRNNRDHRGGSNGLALALGIGILGAVIVSHMNTQLYDQPNAQPYGYGPSYGNQGYGQAYGNQGYGPSYCNQGYGPSYGNQ